MRRTRLGKYLYERGEGRFKHCWKNAQAGFVPSKRGQVGKCSAKITDEVAQGLLDDGIEFKNDDSDPHPERIYNVFDGVPYEATHTLKGVSFHGYPWRGRMPARILRELGRRAEAAGKGREFRNWVNDYGQR